MPYKSDAQRKYFNANRDKLEAQGVDVDEWNESSRGKKLPEKVKEKEASDALNMLHRQASQLLAKFAAEEYERRPKDESENKKPVKKAPPSAKELVNMDSTGGALADYIVPGLWGGERAGRTQAMADAIGEKTTFGVRHPMLQSWGYGLGGGALGALLGGGAGLLAGGLTGGPRNAEELAPIGALLGGGAGLLGGGLLAGRHRRDEMKRIGHFYDQDAAEGKLKPKNPKFSILSALLMPGRGPHRVGQLEATRAIRGDKSMGDQRGGGRDVLYSSRFLPYVGGPMGLLHGYGQNIRTQLASEGDDNAVADSFERRPKAASDVECLARVLAKQARCWEGYEPVPGKEPYSEDSCRPKGSSKKKEKKAESCSCGGPKDACTCDSGPDQSDQSNIAKLARALAKQAGIFYRDLEDPSATIVSDDSGHGLAAMRTQEPRLLTRMFSNPTTDARAAYRHLEKHNPNSLNLSDRPEDHLSNAYGAALRELYPSRYRNPQRGELFNTLAELLKTEEPPSYRQDIQAMRQRYTPMMHQQYEAPLDKEMIGELFSGLEKTYPKRKTKAASDIAELGKLASGAWTRDEGQSDSGGLNAKGRASLKAQGHDIKPPVTEDNPKGERAGRKASFCARMGGMKSKLTSSETANDPDSRINKALRKWNC